MLISQAPLKPDSKIYMYEACDISEVKHVLQHPDIIDRISEDISITRNPKLKAVSSCLAFSVWGHVVGFWIIESRSSCYAVVHPALLPEYRFCSNLFYHLMVKWVRQNTTALRLIGETPSIYRDVIFYALRCGWSKIGVLPMCSIRNGQRYDLILTDSGEL